MIRVRLWLASVAAASALMVGACGDSSASLSPTAPSRSGGSTTTTSATISGRVNGMTGLELSTSSTTPKAATASTNGATVKISGTNISTSVDGRGEFTLTDVPPGTVRLEFSGGGSTATIQISDVRAGDHIEIVVTVNGSNANLRSRAVEMEGRVSGVSGTCPSLTFSLRGRQVRTSGSTSFRDGPCSMIKNDAVVEVKGPVQPDGSIQATSVELEDDADDDDNDNDDGSRETIVARGTVSDLSGACPTLTFRMNGMTIVTSQSTRFDAGCGRVQNGRPVDVSGRPQGRSQVFAVRVEMR